MNLRRVVALTCVAVVMLVASPVFAQNKEPEPTLKGILVAQLKSTHVNSEWFVTSRVALDGVSAEQAKWKDAKGNHSIGQLAYHLLFWNSRSRSPNPVTENPSASSGPSVVWPPVSTTPSSRNECTAPESNS